MTVKDLIAYLEKLPKDTVIGVVYQACSDYTILEEQDMKFCPAPTKEELDTRSDRRLFYPRDKVYVLRHGKIMEYDYKTWDKNEQPHFVPILVLPGN